MNGRKLDHQPALASNGHAGLKTGGSTILETNGGATYPIQFTESKEKNADFPETKVPAGNCFVLGDNRNHAEDSRKYGVVPLGDILGKAEYLYYPASDWSRFGRM